MVMRGVHLKIMFYGSEQVMRCSVGGSWNLAEYFRRHGGNNECNEYTLMFLVPF